MFCNKCGKQLPENARFCENCGAAQSAPQAAPVTPVSQEPAAPAYQQVAAPAYQQVAAPAYQQPVYQPPVTEKPKKKKTGLIIGIIALVAVIAAAGIFLYTSHAAKVASYEEAMELLEAGKHDEALNIFLELEDFEDAADQAKDLQMLKDGYEEAMDLLDDHQYDEAEEAFADLDNYRDSKDYADGGVEYAKASFLLENAQKDDDDALAIALEEMGMTKSDMDGTGDAEASVVKYMAAAEIYGELGDYQDSADKVSTCYCNIALIALELGEVETATACMELMNDADRAVFEEAYNASSADAVFFELLEESLILWWDENGDYLAGEEIELAIAAMDPLAGRPFADAFLEEMYYAYLYALECQLATTDYDGYVENWPDYYWGIADMCYVVDTLNYDYGFLDGSEWEGILVGWYDYYVASAVVEGDICDWYDGDVSAYWSNNGYYYASYTNNSGYDIILTYYADFYYNGQWIESGDYMDVTVPNGATVELPLIPLTLGDDDWHTWSITWWFDFY